MLRSAFLLLALALVSGCASVAVSPSAPVAEPAASPAAREVFQEVDDALGQKLSAIMAEGPDDALTLTELMRGLLAAEAEAAGVGRRGIEALMATSYSKATIGADRNQKSFRYSLEKFLEIRGADAIVNLGRKRKAQNPEFYAALEQQYGVPAGVLIAIHGMETGFGNFMGSTVVRPGPHDPPAPTLALLAGLALYETVAPLLADPSSLSLKWPNDLMLGDAKLLYFAILIRLMGLMQSLHQRSKALTQRR